MFVKIVFQIVMYAQILILVINVLLVIYFKIPFVSINVIQTIIKLNNKLVYNAILYVWLAKIQVLIVKVSLSAIF